MDKIELIKRAITYSEMEQSNLTEDVLKIGGYTSNKIRHLLNNLGMSCNNYLEIGCHRGSTFCATLYGNNIEKALAIDNFSEFDIDNPKLDFLKNVNKFKGETKVSLLEEDCFKLTIDISKYKTKYDLYLYDGNHADWAQEMALAYYYDVLPNEFIFCADDYKWDQVKNGTQKGIKGCNLKVIYEQELGMETNEYWNGFYIALLKKSA